MKGRRFGALPTDVAQGVTTANSHSDAPLVHPPFGFFGWDSTVITGGGRGGPRWSSLGRPSGKGERNGGGAVDGGVKDRGMKESTGGLVWKKGGGGGGKAGWDRFWIPALCP